MKTILVTGVSGFVGKHLVRELTSRGHQVVGLDRSESTDAGIQSLLKTYITCDLTIQSDIDKLPLEEVDGIINLAGLAQVGDSFKQPELYMKINVGVLDTLGQRLLKLKSKARLLAISTGAVYESDQPMPLKEDSATVKESSPYAMSKLAMEDSAHQLKQAGLDCIVARPFNHIGPGQAGGFLLPDLYAKLTIAKDSDKTIKVGNLKTKRDYTDVRDVVRAYSNLITADKLSFETYNICSGTSHSGQEILDSLLESMDLSEIKVEVDQAFIRPNDPPNLYGSAEHLHQDTNWQPQIKLADTIKDFVAANN